MAERRTRFALFALLLACRRGEDAEGSSAPEANAPEAPSVESAPDLDARFEAAWAKAGVEVGPPVDDATFLRRASLDLWGRIPRPEEVQRFVEDPDPEKRERWVERMVADEAFAAYWAELYAGALVGADRLPPATVDAFETWLESGISDGRGWDELAVAMVAAEGALLERPEGVYIASHLRQSGPELLTGAVSRTFLGVQIECAQCHDHPYNRLTQEDFREMAAYFARAKVRRGKLDPDVMSDAMTDAMSDAMSDDKAKKKRRKGDFELHERPRGEFRVPRDPEAPEGKMRSVAPRLFGAAPNLQSEEGSRRRAFATQMVEHELFARAAVGFVWTQLFGRAPVEPWDELGDTVFAREPRPTPELLDYLSEEFIAHDYDLRWLVGSLVRSTAYRRGAGGSADPQIREAAEAAFARAAVRPLRAEQIFRNLMIATVLEEVRGRDFKRRVRANQRAAQKEFEFVFSDDEGRRQDSFSGNVPQALLLWNGALTREGVQRRPGSLVDQVLEAPDFEGRLDALYLRVYGRWPSAAERSRSAAWFEGAIGQTEVEAWEDLAFAMLNSTEFTTNH